MKKLFISSLLVLVSIISFAQDNLKGKWMESMSMLGLTVTETMNFYDNKSGKVVSDFVMDIKIGMLGVKVNGAAAGRLEGTFTYQGDKISIKWNPDSFKFDFTKPITAVYKGEVIDDPKLTDMAKDSFSDIEKDMRKSIEEGDEYFGVQIKGDKLILKSIGEDGKTETEKLTRVK